MLDHPTFISDTRDHPTFISDAASNHLTFISDILGREQAPSPDLTPAHADSYPQYGCRDHSQLATRSRIRDHRHFLSKTFSFLLFSAFSALALLVGRQKEHPAHKKTE